MVKKVVDDWPVINDLLELLIVQARVLGGPFPKGKTTKKKQEYRFILGLNDDKARLQAIKTILFGLEEVETKLGNRNLQENYIEAAQAILRKAPKNDEDFENIFDEMIPEIKVRNRTKLKSRADIAKIDDSKIADAAANYREYVLSKMRKVCVETEKENKRMEGFDLSKMFITGELLILRPWLHKYREYLLPLVS